MLKPRSKLIPKIIAVVFALMIIDALIFWPVLYFKWRDSIKSDAEFKSAPVCSEPDQPGCRREIPSTVKELYTTSSKVATTRYVYLEMPGSELNGRIPIWWDVDHSVYGTLKPGDAVTAEEWNGQITAIRDANAAKLQTEYDPTHERQNFVSALIGIPLVTLLIAFLEYKLIRWLRRTA
jgi:hypothetical protein